MDGNVGMWECGNVGLDEDKKKGNWFLSSVLSIPRPKNVKRDGEEGISQDYACRERERESVCVCVNV